MPGSAETATGPALDYIFHPRSVAVVGVTKQRPGFAGIGTTFLLAMKEMGRDNLYAVNPKYGEVEGVRCYPSIRDIDGPVDHVVSSVPVHAVPGLVDDCIAKGVRTLHFFTAGFSETGDEGMAELEAEVVAKATAAGIRVLGPNCMGLYVPEERLTFTHGTPRESGPVGAISQSGGNAIDFVMTAAARGIRYSKVVSYGNGSDLREGQLLEYLAADPATEIIAAYIEGVRDGRRFFDAMRKASAVKPVIVLKGGRTEAGGRATMSHTASLAGAAAVFEAACRQANAVQVKSVDEMADLAVAFRYMGAPKGEGIAVVGGGGGFSVFAADEIAEAGLKCPVLPERTQAQLREFTPVAGASVRNPVDVITVFEPPKLEQTLRIIGEAENIDAIAFHTTLGWGNAKRLMAGLGADPAMYMELIVERLVRARDACGTPVVVVLRPPLDVEGTGRAVAFQEKCWRAGLPVFPTIPRAANAIAKLLRWAQAREAP